MTFQYNFGFASRDENMVAGAQRPGYPNEWNIGEDEIQPWIKFMRKKGIEGVVCLLPEEQLAYYAVDLLEIYRKAFGKDMACWAPVKDHYLMDKESLKRVLSFLDGAVEKGKKVVVHCSAGMGRTGVVLAAWLVHRYDLSLKDALDEVVNVDDAVRYPDEAVDGINTTRKDLFALLESARQK